MKIWQATLLTMLLATMPVFSACELLGGSQQRQQQEYYREEANRQRQEAYNKQLEQGLNEWSKAYREYQQKQQEQQLQQLEERQTDTQS